MKQKWSKIIALCLVFTLLAGQLVEAVTYSANRSTFYDGRNKTKTQDKNNELIIKYAGNKEYLRAGLIGFALPQDDYSDVTKATLRLFLTHVSQLKSHAATEAAVQVFGFDSAWDEKTVTWDTWDRDNRPDFSGEVKVGDIHLPAQVNEWLELDVTDYFTAKIANTTDFSFRLVSDPVTEAYMKLASANHGNRPQLVLERGSIPPVSGDTQVDVDTDNVDR